jgi:hypothetical protein
MVKTNIIEKYDKHFAYTGVLINLIMVYQFYILLTNPGLEDAHKIYTIAILTGFEFIMVHSGVFMSVFPKKITLYFLFPIYGLFALAFNSMVEGNYILYLYLIIVFNRMRFAFADVSPAMKNRAVLGSVFNAMTWFVLIFVFAFNAEKFKVFGLTDAYLTLSGYYEISGSDGGLTAEMPNVALLFAITYYLFLALIEFFLIRTFSYKKMNVDIFTMPKNRFHKVKK